jgi:hypothetical protein
MTVLDDTTQGWPLPHPDNPARLDVQRIRDTLVAIAALLETIVTDDDVTTAVNAAIASLVGDAPAALDTLKEIADALGDDSNYAATITTLLAAKADSDDLAEVATSGSYNDLDDKPEIGTAAEKDTGASIGDVVLLEDVGGLAGLPAVSGKNLTDLPGALWSAISTTPISGLPTEIVFDDLDCEEIKFTINNAKANTSDTLYVATSTNNGASWQNIGAISPSGTSSLYGSLLMTGLKLGDLVGFGAVTTGSIPKADNGSYVMTASRGAQINAIRFYWSSGATFGTGGSINVQTR